MTINIEDENKELIANLTAQGKAINKSLRFDLVKMNIKEKNIFHNWLIQLIEFNSISNYGSFYHSSSKKGIDERDIQIEYLIPMIDFNVKFCPYTTKITESILEDLR